MQEFLRMIYYLQNLTLLVDRGAYLENPHHMHHHPLRQRMVNLFQKLKSLNTRNPTHVIRPMCIIHKIIIAIS